MRRIIRANAAQRFLKALLFMWTLEAFFILTPRLYAQTQFRLRNGKISHVGKDGAIRQIRINEQCSDLWVAPAQDTIAFISIDKTMPVEQSPLGYEEAAIPEKTRVYVARESKDFLPELLISKPIELAGRPWSVFRNPSLSPNQQILYFSIPYTMTTSKLMSFQILSRQYRAIGDVTAYCTIWNGRYSGDQLLQKRYFAKDLRVGIVYRCYLRSEGGKAIKMEERCDEFGNFARRWTAARGGNCSLWEILDSINPAK